MYIVEFEKFIVVWMRFSIIVIRKKRKVKLDFCLIV